MGAFSFFDMAVYTIYTFTAEYFYTSFFNGFCDFSLHILTNYGAV